jgi:anthrone oxygenase-like protein
VQVHQLFAPLVDRYMPASAIISGLAALANLVAQHNLTSLSATFTMVGMAGTAGGILVSLLCDLPADRVIAGWSPEAVPADSPRVLRDWDRIHAIRTAMCGLALACYILAALVR